MDFADDFIEEMEPTIANQAAKADVERLQQVCARTSLPSQQAEVGDDMKHIRKCRKHQCFRCNYIRHGDELQKITPIARLPEIHAKIPLDKAHLAKLSWLSSAKVDGNWGITVQ